MLVIATGAVGIVVAIIVCVIFAGLILYVSTTSSKQAPITRVEPDQLDWDALLDTELQNYLRQGRKINAIKRYRELTNVGLKEAKDAVEYAEAHPDQLEDHELDGRKSKNDLHDSGSTLPPMDAGIRELVRYGRKIEAIKAYREFTGASLEDARTEIERIEWEEAQRSQHSSQQNGARQD